MQRRGFYSLPLLPLSVPSRAEAADGALEAAIGSPLRSGKNLARDPARHPAAVLRFFGVRNDDTVIEAEPGGGYWTEILAPYLRRHGAYIAALAKGEAAARAFFLKKFVGDPADYGKIGIIGLDGAPPGAKPDSADLILSFRNLHDWMALGTAPANLAMFHRALKPGGVFGIEDHRGAVNIPQDPAAKNGYVRQDYAIALIQQAGFKLLAASEIGANPKDTKNYPDGVWTLPPVLRLGAVDRAKYLSIGESDRFTLKFIKPAG